jgi:radical SAM superfamily enzyme YgiQ (UPF0313 family)
MPDVVLTTLNAKYIHSAFGLRYLMANLGELRSRARMMEFDINQRPLEIAEAILDQKPKILGIGVYIWNALQSTQLVADLKRLRPDLSIVLGGPEVSFETDQQEIVRMADYIITGEADVAFAELSGKLMTGKRPTEKIIPATLPQFNQLTLPYDLYDERDVQNRIVYVEASRGCPFTCEFCLSSLDIPVRNAPLGPFLAAMESLLDRGVKHFKFVDRTFNLNLAVGQSILRFFLERYRPGLFLHFEMIPDRFPDALRELVKQFPPGALQFEVGIQTFNDDVARLISRRQDNARVEENLKYLRDQTGVHVHADLIAGLPGEDLPSFARGFDRLVAMRPQEIQVGILKRLRGTPIVRHDQEWGMIYSPNPPYEVLQTKLIDFSSLQRLRRFARFWDLIANSGNFVETSPLLWRRGSAFGEFMKCVDWIYERAGRTHAIALSRLSELLFEYLCEAGPEDPSAIAQTLWRDYQRGGRNDVPEFLRRFVKGSARTRLTRAATLPRQTRHSTVMY